MNNSLSQNALKISKPLHGKRRCNNIVSIVVTYNRKEMLLKCLDLLLNQKRQTDILIVDNASTDGTEHKLKSSGLMDEKRIHYVYLNQNTGGAGGFHYGLKYAFEHGWNWFWLMDDDAEPHIDSLEKLFLHASNYDHIYGSVAVSNTDGSVKLCFPAKIIIGSKTKIVEDYDKLASEERVAWLPFLGFFVHRNTIKKIGLPDKKLFIRNDDIEFSERAKKQSIGIYLIKESIIEHPFQPTIPFFLFSRQLYYRSMPPWKMYYEVRNKIIIAKRHYTLLSGIKSFSGVSLQVLLSLLFEKDKNAYLKSYFNGILDGIKTP